MDDSLDDKWPTQDIPIRDALIGETISENERHAISRVAFLRLLLNSEAWFVRATAWAEHLGLKPKAQALAGALDELASVLGVDHRGWLWGIDNPVVKIECETPEQRKERVDYVKGIMDRIDNAVEDFHKTLEGLDHKGLSENVIRYLNELGLPWPWLAVELIEAFIYGVASWALGLKLTKTVWTEPVDPPAPQIAFSFQTRSGETVTEAVGRLIAELSGVVGALQSVYNEHAIPRGRPPCVEVVERYTEWFYRHKIGGESINSIAKSGTSIPYDRKHVRQGIKEAKRLLELTQYTF